MSKVVVTKTVEKIISECVDREIVLIRDVFYGHNENRLTPFQEGVIMGSISTAFEKGMLFNVVVEE
jgi:hypothetical protein